MSLRGGAAPSRRQVIPHPVAPSPSWSRSSEEGTILCLAPVSSAYRWNLGPPLGLWSNPSTTVKGSPPPSAGHENCHATEPLPRRTRSLSTTFSLHFSLCAQRRSVPLAHGSPDQSRTE